MQLLDGAWHYLVPFLLVLTVLVFVHELGHFLVARWAGVRVEVFSIGFGPELVGWTDRRKTRWKISILPLGGYVRMFGDANAAGEPDKAVERMNAAERAVSFHHKPVGPRAAIVVAGPVANFIFTFAALAGLFAFVGQPFVAPVLNQIEAGSPAAKAGLRAGDKVVTIDQTAITDFDQVKRLVEIDHDRPLAVTVERGGETLTFHVAPTVIQQRDNLGRIKQVGHLGVLATTVEHIRYAPWDALSHAASETAFLTGATVKAVGEMIAGTRTTAELSGPLGIAQMSGQMARGGVDSTIWFMAVLSLNLGLINLVPIPMLDGGHLLFYAYEALRRRPLAPRIQDYGFRIGLTLVLLLMIFATWNDLVHLKVVQFVANLIS